MNFDGFKLEWLLGIGPAASFILWALTQLMTTKKDVETVKDQLQEYKVYASENYVKKTDFAQLRKEIREDFDKVDKKLDKIVERVEKN
ncbi:hypothetical protein RO21_06025 [[Actinobacillus] muris]|uniref:Uncharacterized protein n=1 Tax=Muribacter muris TaxID=67855 RepID=A0A0J5P7K5_9PAST|nr:hypothetical protein [Muribacter muris]KMK51469.1 hypothetical protein RO21_06025 [[Actinobacillus] muris] [Muribacter muris]